MSVAENGSSSDAEPVSGSIYMLDTSWATTADERRHLHWELLASDQVRGAFLTARDDALVVVFSGDRRAFDAFESGLPEVRCLTRTHDSHTASTTTNKEGAL